MRFLIYTCLCFCLIACTTNESKSDQTNVSGKVSGMVQLLDTEQFKKKLADTTKPQLIDVRTPREIAEGAINNAINIDFNSNDFEGKFEELDKKRPVFVYCRSGGRSGKTANKLKQMGFTEIYDLEGGYQNWKK